MNCALGSPEGGLVLLGEVGEYVGDVGSSYFPLFPYGEFEESFLLLLSSLAFTGLIIMVDDDERDVFE